MTVADYIANQLFNSGVRYIYGIPGGPSIPYMEAFRRAGIEFILVSNEASAGIMADVTARLTGNPGVCHATFGPGATNISTGIGGALLDRSPVIVLTSEMDDKMLGRTTQMNINHQKLFSAVTKSTFRLSEQNAAEILNNALSDCMEEYPGPVHIGLPVGIHDSEISESRKPSVRKASEQKNDIQEIESLLDTSRRPLLAIGLTSKRMAIRKEILSFLERNRMPVLLTPMAKGLIPVDHPCYAGVLFHALSNCMEDLYDKCDLVIGLGYDQVEYNYESWLPDVPLIHFDTVMTDLPEREHIYRFVGKPEEWFSILGRMNSASLGFNGSLIRGIKDEMASVFEGFSSHFGPVSALKVLRSELPDDAILTADVGSHVHLLGQYWNTGESGEFIMSNGWSGMGFGIPAALVASIIRPDKRVVCITGDGGFLMMAGEMVTARRNKLPVIIVVLSDGELNLIKLKQSWRDIPACGTDLYCGDLFGSETFLGVKVLRADNSQMMENCIRTALSMSEPVIINAIIDSEDYKYLIVRQY